MRRSTATTPRSSSRRTPRSTASRRRKLARASCRRTRTGPGTAAALAAVGIADVRIPETTFDSEGLLALPELADVRGKRIAIFRGEGGRDCWATRCVRAARASTTSDCYRRARAESGADGLVEALRARARARADAHRRAKASTTCARCSTQTRVRACARSPTFVPHPRIAEHARDSASRAIDTGSGDAGLIAGLLEWFASRHSTIPKATRHGPARHHRHRTAAAVPLRAAEGATIAATTTTRRATSPGLLAAEGARIRGLVQGGGTVTPTTLLDALPKLEIISVFGVGYDGVPVDYCRQRGIKVTNTPDVLTDDVADVAVGPRS